MEFVSGWEISDLVTQRNNLNIWGKQRLWKWAEENCSHLYSRPARPKEWRSECKTDSKKKKEHGADHVENPAHHVQHEKTTPAGSECLIPENVKWNRAAQMWKPAFWIFSHYGTAFAGQRVSKMETNKCNDLCFLSIQAICSRWFLVDILFINFSGIMKRNRCYFCDYEFGTCGRWRPKF